jgi:ketosteroid isomerase-like protein
MASLAGAQLKTDIGQWFVRWAECVRAQDYAAARRLFSPDVVGFGTRMHVVRGLDRLEELQWSQVWPTIDGFSFVLDELVAVASEDGSQAYAVVPWVSTGFHEDGSTFDRPGRATVVFAHEGDPRVTPGGWRAVHTHISLAPGAPQRSYGRPESR